tara:strand:+ start:274 stop:405 length:132 start_codon:yes stop_codon:yes gene_type:complete
LEQELRQILQLVEEIKVQLQLFQQYLLLVVALVEVIMVIVFPH